MADIKITGKERGTRMLGDLVPLFSESDRATIKTLLEKPENAKVVEALGEAALRQDEFSRGMSEAQQLRKNTEEWHAKLAAWEKAKEQEYRDKLAALDAGGGRMIDGGTGDGGQQKVDLAGYVTKEEAARQLAEGIQAATNTGVNAAAFFMTLGAKHMKEFDEPLDQAELLKFCRERQVNVDAGGYEAFVKERRDARAAEKHKQELAEAERRGYLKARNEDIPSYIGDGAEGGMIAGLLKKPSEKSGAVADAVRTYDELMRKKVGVGV